MHRLWLSPFAALVVVLAGCVGGIDSAHFGPPAAIERAITRHFERYASEGNCFNPYIDGFTRLTVLEDTPDRLLVHARYFYRDRFQEGGAGAGGQICAGFGERTFTVARGADGGPVVIEMTGEQDEPAIRSLIRRASFPTDRPGARTRAGKGVATAPERQAEDPAAPW